jgi:hypothetical protein
MAQLINEAKRMQLLAGLITESQLNEEAINFGDKDQFSDFLQNKTKELEGKTIKLSVFDTFAMGDPEKEKFTGDISVNLGKRTGGTGNLIYDATLVDAGGYKYLSPAKGKKISLTIPSTTGGQGGFENEELKLKGLFKVKSLEMPETQQESQTNELFGFGKKSQFKPEQKVIYTASNGVTTYNGEYIVGKVFSSGEIGLYPPDSPMKKISINAKPEELKLAESTDIERAVNEALRKFRKQK